VVLAEVRDVVWFDARDHIFSDQTDEHDERDVNPPPHEPCDEGKVTEPFRELWQRRGGYGVHLDFGHGQVNVEVTCKVAAT
jgi:hypothetical protein